MQDNYARADNQACMNKLNSFYARHAVVKPRGRMLCALAALLFGSLIPQASAQTGQLTVSVGKPGAKISPLFYGLMTEEINHSYDGGLYAELIQNRSLDDNPALPAHWSLVTEGGGAGSIALDSDHPVPGTARTHALRLDSTTAGGAAHVGAANDGFWGIPVRPRTRYQMSFYAKLDGAAHVGTDAALTTLTGQNSDVNSIDAPRRVAPVATVLHDAIHQQFAVYGGAVHPLGARLVHTFPARSVSILRISAH